MAPLKMALPLLKSLTMKILLFSLFFGSLAFGAPLFTEVGPLSYGHTDQVPLTESGSSFRIQSFGNTVVSLTVKGGQNNLPQITFEGPLADNGDSILPGSGPQFSTSSVKTSKSGQAINVQAQLTQPGVYRVLLHSNTTTPANFLLRSQCLGGCNRHEISAKEFLDRLKNRGDLKTIESSLGELFHKYANNPDLSAKFNQGLQNLMNEAPEKLSRFPLLNLSEIGQFQPVIEEAEMAKAHAGSASGYVRPADPVLSGDLVLAVNSFGKLTRAGPANVNGHLPGVGNGDFVNLALTKDQIVQSQGLAQVLTSLSVSNGSSINYNGKVITAPGPLLAELAATGHKIKVSDQRTYANFISFNDGEDIVRWPSWIDTGLKLPSGVELVVPMAHAQIAWEITGPLINARTTFYLGISGAGFFPNIHLRPSWTGLRENAIALTGKDAGQISLLSQTTEAAASYLRRVRVEADTYAKGLKNDGYGVVEGVCCDSVAAIESKLKLLENEIPYPLLRSKILETEAPLHDGFDDTLVALPRDTQNLAVQNPGSATDNKVLIRRIEGMIPSAVIAWDSSLQTVATELRSVSSSFALVPSCVVGMDKVTPPAGQ